MAKKKHAQEDAAEKTEMKNQETEQAAERDEALKTAEEKAGKAAEEAEKLAKVIALTEGAKNNFDNAVENTEVPAAAESNEEN